MHASSISAVCVTYARQAWLERAVECFCRQEYQGAKELVILNTCPQQKLMFEDNPFWPWIKVHNLTERPKTLGEARNLAVGHAHSDIIVTWDDDDVFLPHHLSTIAANFEGLDWIWLDKQFWAVGEDIHDIVPGACPVFSFTKDSWFRVGGYQPMGVGEDANFIAKVTSYPNHSGKKVIVEGVPSFIYQWGQGVYHASGMGTDKPGVLPMHQRIEDDFKERVRRGQEKTGTIVLKPSCPIDWVYKANAFIEQRAQKKSEPQKVCMVQLGRFGDVANVLPIARHIAAQYGPPHFMISKEFAPLLDGCSYVIPYPVDVKNDQVVPALAMAQKQFPIVINCAIWGTKYEITKECASYNRESWRLAGFAHKFDNQEWRPVFDRRDSAREQALWSKIDDGRRVLLVNVTSGVSSPFPFGVELLALIRKWYWHLNIVDAGSLRLPQITDIISLIERATAVVTMDTGLLHFAAATETPVIALVNPNHWQGSECRSAYSKRMTYDEARDNPIAVRESIDFALTAFPSPPHLCHVEPLQPPPVRRIFHCVERHEEQNPKEQARKAVAQASWDVLYSEHGVIPCHMWNFPRTALSIGDPRPLPYLKDILMGGINQAADDDIIIWTNDDNWLHPDLPDLLRFHVAVFEACTSQRIEVKDGGFPRPNSPPSVWRSRDVGHLGRDLFAATRRWLMQHWDEIPDFILGASDFDLCLAAMVRKTFNIETTRQNIAPAMWPAEIERGYIAHQWHLSKWTDPKNINSAPSQIHNRTLWREWSRIHLPNLQFTTANTI